MRLADRRGPQPGISGVMRHETAAVIYVPCCLTSTLAQPVDWETREDEEARFEDAERKRLLYVAATRAGCMIVVSHPTGRRVRSKNPWQQLAESIPDNARLDPPTISRPAPPLRPTLPATAPAKAVAEIMARVERSVRPTYEVEKIKEIALKGRRTKAPAGEHGTEWGTVLHTVLEAAMAHPDGNTRVSHM